MLRHTLAALILATALPACAQQAAEEAPPETDAAGIPAAFAGTLVGETGEDIGAVSVQEGPHGMLLEVTVQPGGLAPGWHGLHLHQVPDCSDVGEFKRSGGHLGLIEGGHGLLNPAGPEKGDLPNIWAGADGAAGYEAHSTLFTVDDVRENDGVALIIHANRDDHTTQPIGGAGPRVGCAVIR